MKHKNVFNKTSGNVLSVSHKTSVELYQFILAQLNIQIVAFDAAGRALVRSATNAFLIDTVTGAVYSITIEMADVLLSQRW